MQSLQRARRGATLKAVVKRFRRIEEKLGPALETEFSRRLWKRLEAVQRRAATAEENGELERHADVFLLFQMRGIIEILQSRFQAPTI